MYPPDVSDWPEDHGIPIPFEADDLMTILSTIRGYNCLAHEFDTELLRCTEDTTCAPIIHTIFPEPHKGFSSIMHFKMWLKFNADWHLHVLMVFSTSTVLCSTGLGASKIAATPSSTLVEFGVTFIGLHDDDWEFFAPNLRPAYTGDEVRAVHPTFNRDYLIPPALIESIDVPHEERNFRRNFFNEGITWVVESIKRDGIEVGKWASGRNLKKLASLVGIKGKYSLAEIVNVNEWCDQRGKAAKHLISLKTYNLLKRHNPEDTASLLLLKAMYFQMEPHNNPKFTNPFKIAYYVERGLAVFNQQELYVTKLMKRLDLHCASYQFREGLRILAASAILHCLAHCRWKEQVSVEAVQEWDDLGLAHNNNNVVEAHHSEERKGTEMRTNDSSNDLSQHLDVMSKVEQISDCKEVLRAAEAKLAEAKRHHGEADINTLGYLPGVTEADVHYGRHSEERVLDTYDQFCEQISYWRQRSREGGLADYGADHPNVKEQCEAAGCWGTKRVQKLPAGTTVCSGPIRQQRMPLKCVDPDAFVAAYSPDALKKLSNLEASVRQEQMRNAVAEGDGASAEEVADVAGGSTRWLTPAVSAIITKTKIQRAAMEELSKHGDGSVMVATHSGQVMVHESLLTGDVVMASDGTLIKTHQFLKLFQKRDRHSNDRGRRFWVGRLREFQRAVDDEHDVLVGSCMFVNWGKSGGKDVFVVGRVMSIHDGEVPHKCSAKLGTAGLSYIIEMLDPAGSPTESGPQRYRASGYCLPRILGKFVISLIKLRHLDALSNGQTTTDALVPVEDLLKMYNKGYVRLQSGAEVETEAERIEHMDSGVQWCTQEAETACYMCQSKWYDDSTGLIIRCSKCKHSWHQECHYPTVWTDSLQLGTASPWMCSVCSGDEVDVCHRCHKDWSMKDEEEETDNDRLMYCEGVCGRLFHQKCHDPCVSYPGPTVKWYCGECEDDRREAIASDVADIDQTQFHPRHRACKKTWAGASNERELFGVSTIKDAPESRLKAATWDRLNAKQKSTTNSTAAKRNAPAKPNVAAKKASAHVDAATTSEGEMCRYRCSFCRELHPLTRLRAGMHNEFV